MAVQHGQLTNLGNNIVRLHLDQKSLVLKINAGGGIDGGVLFKVETMKCKPGSPVGATDSCV